MKQLFIFTVLLYLFIVLFLHQVNTFVFTNENNVTFIYAISFQKKCRKLNDVVLILNSVSITDCVEECGLRQHCASLNYKRRYHVCELFSSADEGDEHSIGCIFIPASEITVKQDPCADKDCTTGKACTDSTMTCTHKECVNEAVLLGGTVLGNMNQIGSKIKYTCNNGLKVPDNEVNAVCLNTGHWSQTSQCLSACGDVPSITKGIITIDTTNLNKAYVTCNDGYQPTLSTITCQQGTSAWQSVSCELIACGNPSPISNGNIDLTVSGSYYYLDTADVTCSTGYQPNVNSITCTQDGSWETASCARISCGNPPSISDGNIALDTVNGNLYLDTASVTCNTGYIASTTSISCTATGTWQTATCDLITCGTPSPISNGNIDLTVSGSYYYLDTADVTCSTGYQPNVISITCTLDGSWETASCAGISCGNPPSISDGNIALGTMNGNLYLDTASVICNTGYTASTTSISCTATGTWQTATCDLITCGNTPSIANGGVTLSVPGANMYQDTAVVTCDTWFQTTTDQITCTGSGSWTQATCTDVLCYPGTPWEYEGKVSVTITGRTCQRWDQQVPHSHNTELQYFPDSSLSEASNYCRNPESGSYDPWCYTTDPNKEWEYCSLVHC